MFTDGLGDRARFRYGNASLAPLTPRLATVYSPAEQAQFRAVLTQELSLLQSNSYAASTLELKQSLWSYWQEFAERTGICTLGFARSASPSREELCQEQDILTALLLYASAYPRSAAKRKLAGTAEGRNSIKYAVSVVSTVRLWYEERRGSAVGLRAPNGENCARFAIIRKSLAKMKPSARPPRPPVLVQHMRALYDTVDQTSHFDRSCWCLALSCWLNIFRVGDWLAASAEQKKGWRAAYRSHRARLALRQDADGFDVIIIGRKPPTEDPTGENHHEAAFKTGLLKEKLCGGNAWRRMLQGDELPAGTDLTKVPIFRHQGSGPEITKAEFKSWVEQKFILAGLPQFGRKTHSFRIGGATTLAELEGEAAARGMGGWVSAAMLQYLHMSQARRLVLAERMANGPDLVLRADSRPIGRR